MRNGRVLSRELQWRREFDWMLSDDRSTNSTDRAVVGALGCGQIADWLGRRAVIMMCLVVSFVAITMEFVATTNELFFGGKFLNGFAIGALSSVCVTYIGEVRMFPFISVLLLFTY